MIAAWHYNLPRMAPETRANKRNVLDIMNKDPYESRGVAQPRSAPALGARCFIPRIPPLAFVSNVFNKWGNLLLAQSQSSRHENVAFMHSSCTVVRRHTHHVKSKKTSPLKAAICQFYLPCSCSPTFAPFACRRVTAGIGAELIAQSSLQMDRELPPLFY
jgi:hypothetical protein